MRAKKRSNAPDYELLKQRARERNIQSSLAGRDVAPLPAIENPERRAQTTASFRAFCETYFPETFSLPWSPDHLKVIGKIEEAVLRGGLFALAMPRGGGKTSLCEAAALWAICIGARRFVALIGSDEDSAQTMLASIKVELECNERLHADWPELTHPVRSLDRIANRCTGQLFGSAPTYIEWKADVIALGMIPRQALAGAGVPEANGTGAIIKVAGITGRIRGMKHKRSDGRAVRPDFVIPDDPQTDESARSLTQCQARESVLAGAVLGLAGPDKRICGIMPLTVIRPGDMADRILNRELYPQWQGERLKMLYKFPSNMRLWEKYADLLRSDSDNYGVCLQAATEFYREHREAMDAGAEVAWPERFEPGELSGIQCAMNIKIGKEQVFYSEYQNDPLPERPEQGDALTPDDVAAKVNGYARATVPVTGQVLTAFVDVQQKLLFYVVCAWAPDFTGYVVDYGTYPDQHRAYFTARDAQRTIQRAHRGTGPEGAIFAGLEALVGDLVKREWQREDGAVLKTALCLIDQGWNADVVHQFCRQSPHAALVMPARGHAIGASQKPLEDYDRKRGDQIGFHWWIPAVLRGRRVLRHVETDVNFWKTFIHQRLSIAQGDKGCLSLWGKAKDFHRLFAEHVTCEYRVQTQGRGRTVDEWKLPPARPDNHWFDCMVGCAAAASMRGVSVASAVAARSADGENVIMLSELQRTKRAQREAQARARAASGSLRR